MSEIILFNKIFIDRRRSGVNYALLTHKNHKDSIISHPSYKDWLDVIENFELYDCFIEPNLTKLGKLWCDGNLNEKYWDIPYATTPITGLSILKNLNYIDADDEIDYSNMYTRIIKLITMACEIMKDPVRSPPVLGNFFNNVIHPGSTLSEAHLFLKKPMRVLLMKPKEVFPIPISEPITILQVNKKIETLADLESCYEGDLIGFIEKRDNIIHHLHMYSYHSNWTQPDDHGYIEYPEFDIISFFDLLNNVLPDNCEQVFFNYPYTDHFIKVKISDDMKLMEKVFKLGSERCFK